MKPLVSVIIPTHNHRRYLSAAIDSIYQQSFKVPTEVIVVDDSSIDYPENVCQSLGTRYFRVEARNGNVARNKGVAEAGGEIMIFLDADNTLKPNFFALALPPLLSGTADLVYGRLSLFGDLSIHSYIPHNQMLVTVNDLKNGNLIDSCCAVKRDKLTDKSWDENLQRYQDWDFHLTNLERGLRYQFIDQEIYNYYLCTVAEEENKLYRNDKIDQQSFTYVRRKHQLDNPGEAKITIGLVSIGRYFCVQQWLESVANLDWPAEEIDLFFIDQSQDENFFRQQLIPFIKQYKQRYHSIYVAVKNEPPVFEPGQGDERFIRTADNFNYLTYLARTPYLFLLEDDATVEPDSLRRLASILDNHPDAVAASGVERSRAVKYSIGVRNFVGVWGKDLYYRRRKSGLQVVGSTGTYCVLLRTAWTQDHPFQPLHIAGGGPDFSLGWRIIESGYKTYVDWSVKCRHHVLDSTGRVYPLSLDSFNEPSKLFPQEYRDPDSYLYEDNFLAEYQPSPELLTGNESWCFVFLNIDGPLMVKRHLDSWPQPQTKRLIYLLPNSQAAYDKLAESEWPSGTVLKSIQSNIADVLNQAFQQKTSLTIILNSQLEPNRLLLETALMAVKDQSLVFGYTGSINDMAQPKNKIMSVDDLSTYTSNIDLCVIKTSEQNLSAIFDPVFGQEPSLIGPALQLAAKRIRYSTTSNSLLFSIGSSFLEERGQSKNRQQFFFLLGVLSSREFPLRRIISFTRVTVSRSLKANWLEYLYFGAGILKDAGDRLRWGKRRHLLY